MMSLLRNAHVIGLCLLATTANCDRSLAQKAPSAPSPQDRLELSGQELNGKIELLTRSLEQTQTELARSRSEIEQLRAMLGEVLKRMDATAAVAPQSANPAAGGTPGVAGPEQTAPAAQVSQDDWDLLNARVEEQRQTKVESGSKFRLRLSGIALFNAFDTSGSVDNLDLPAIATPRIAGNPAGGLGASVRQSIIGLTGIGPEIFGARTSAELEMGFYGGLPSGYNATTSGIANLRIARIRFDWENTSVIAGLDTPFFSPNMPSTYMSVAVPGFASAGNLWTWTPTIRVEQRFGFGGTGSPFKLEAGLLDPSSNINYTTNNNLRTPSPTESSRIPTYAFRFSYNRKSEDRPASFGVAGVYSPQQYFGGYRQEGWGAITDWKFGLLPRTEVSGQFFTGRGLDGFGALPEDPFPVQNPVYYNTFIAPLLANVGVMGGWTQLKFRLNAQNEFNVAAGTGDRKAAALRQILGTNFAAPLIPARNEMVFANYIFRPRSDLVFSAEYRRLRTYEVTGAPDRAGQVGLSVGFLF
jgi:hypothetical protein